MALSTSAQRGAASFSAERLLGLVLTLLSMVSLNAQWTVFDMTTAGFPSNTVRALTVANNGDVWAGTEYGLMRYDGSAWETFQTTNSAIPDNDVRALDASISGGVWVGTLSGLALFEDGTWTTYNTGNSGMPEDYVRCLEADPNGGIWVGTAGGLAWFDGGSTWHVYTMDGTSYNGLQLPGINIASLALRADGLLCVGTLNAGFTYLTDTSVTVYTTFQNGLPDNTGLGVALDASGDRWIACPAGALLYHAGNFIGGSWVQFNTINSGIPSDALNCIVVDAGGRRIMGTQNAGIGILSGFGQWTGYQMSNSDIPGDEVFCLALDHDGALWVGTSAGGAARFDYTAGVEEAGVASPVQVFPSPCAERLNWIRPSGGAAADMRVIDATGRIVRTGVLTGVGGELDVAGLAGGSYALVISEKGSGITHTVRFLKA